MANHKSAEKRIRQSARRNEINRRNRSALRTQIRTLRTAISEGRIDDARGLLAATVSQIDRSIQAGIIHANAAARQKARLTVKVNQMEP